jgi:hypothetical protein
MTNIGKLPIQLGKRAPRLDKRTFRLARYLPAIIPPPPVETDGYVTKVPSWPMYLNDSLGDCVAAAAGHIVNQETFYASGTEKLPTDNDILKTYEAVGGYIPGDPNTDNGMDMLSYLKYWRSTGVGGHKILGFVGVDLTRRDEIMQAIQLFGNVYLGIQLPISAQVQTAWKVPAGGPFGDGSPGSWGGHCVPMMFAGAQTSVVVTWGNTLHMDWDFLTNYADEAYVVLSNDWIKANGVSPSKFNLAQLQADLALL